METLITAISEVEGLADALAMTRQKMVDLDIQRQSMREAARAVQKQHQSIANRDRIWVMHPGNVALHETPQDALQWMDAESQKLEKEVLLLRQRQKQLVSLISDKSGIPDGCGPEMLKAFLTLVDDE